MIKHKNIYPFAYKLMFIFIVLTIANMVVGFRYFNKQNEEINKEKYEELSAIAELKFTEYTAGK